MLPRQLLFLPGLASGQSCAPCSLIFHSAWVPHVKTVWIGMYLIQGQVASLEPELNAVLMLMVSVQDK